MILFAQASDWWLASIITVSTLIGGAIVWLANFLINRQKQRREWYKEDQRSIVEHQNETINRLIKEVEELKREVGQLRSEVTENKSHMMYLEGILDSKGVPYRQSPLDPSSGKIKEDTGGP